MGRGALRTPFARAPSTIAYAFQGRAKVEIRRGSLPFMAVCHEYRPSTRRCVTVREMKEGPSRSAIRC